MSTNNKTEDSQLSLTGMATQLGINVAIALGVLIVFNILRPNNSRMQCHSPLINTVLLTIT